MRSWTESRRTKVSDGGRRVLRPLASFTGWDARQCALVVSSPAVHYTGYHMTKVHCLLLSLLLPVAIAAQRSGTLTGPRVGEQSSPLAEARIRIAGVGMVVSAQDGRCPLTVVSHGDHR